MSNKMKKRVLITGVTGFAGSHLAEYLTKLEKYELYGTYLTDDSLENVSIVRKDIKLLKIDLVNEEEVFKLIESVKPDFVLHLAALPAVGDSFKNPAGVLMNNVTAQTNLLESIRKLKLALKRIIIVSSADVYGKVDKKDLPINENTPFMPTNTYGVSKITQDFLGLQYFISYGIPIVRVRPFNHIGPRQGPGYVVADFARKIALIEKRLLPPMLRVGNLNTKRDFTDVRDMVRAYALLMEKGKAGDVYNIGSGKSYSISTILKTLLSFAKVKISVTVDQSLLRDKDVTDRICDNSKIKRLISWQPSIALEVTLRDTLEYWRNIV